jgi:hypothetical protein
MKLESIMTFFFYITLLLLLYRIFFKKESKQLTQLFIVSSALITILLISVIEHEIHHLLRSEFRIPNTLTYLLILIPIGIHFYKFYNLIINSNYIFIIMSLVFMGFALLLDLLTDAKVLIMGSSDFIEEILKIAGAFFWMLYYVFLLV